MRCAREEKKTFEGIDSDPNKFKNTKFVPYRRQLTLPRKLLVYLPQYMLRMLEAKGP